MGVIKRVVKPRNQRSKRALEEREPKIIENTKKALFLHGQNTSEVGRQLLKDLYSFKKEYSSSLSKKHKILPFEDVLPLERMSEKLDSSLFAMCNHSKKRPNNVIFGRMYDHHLLDMLEFGIEDFQSLREFTTSKISCGTKPCMIFCGDQFDEEIDYKNIKNYFIDFFRGVQATDIRLQGFEHVLLFTAIEGSILFRSYKILLKKSGTRTPRVELEEIGPSFTMILRRNKFASEDLLKASLKQHKQLKKKKVKNVEKDVFGTKLGRVHMTKQDYGKLQTRKRRALKIDPKKKSAKPKDTPAPQPMETD